MDTSDSSRGSSAKTSQQPPRISQTLEPRAKTNASKRSLKEILGEKYQTILSELSFEEVQGLNRKETRPYFQENNQSIHTRTISKTSNSTTLKELHHEHIRINPTRLPLSKLSVYRQSEEEETPLADRTLHCNRNSDGICISASESTRHTVAVNCTRKCKRDKPDLLVNEDEKPMTSRVRFAANTYSDEERTQQVNINRHNKDQYS